MSTVLLAIETSCDDTAAAVIVNGAVASNIIASQGIHNEWGGIVPELASREHIKAIGWVVKGALAEAQVTFNDLTAIAVTNGPGLPGSLLVGAQYAKGLGRRLGIPVIPVQHIEAHVFSTYLEEPQLPFPSICLVVSGGHTALFLVESWHSYSMIGSTRDDAAGEAFDKVAKLLGLGYPGGPLIDKLARQGQPTAFAFPRALMHDQGFDFSFSGLKTAVRRAYTAAKESVNTEEPTLLANIAASAQQAIVDALVHKTIQAAEHYGVSAISIAGGVSANSSLRSTLLAACEQRGWKFVAPRMEYCIDNAAMIGHVASMMLNHGLSAPTQFTIAPRAMRARGNHTNT